MKAKDVNIRYSRFTAEFVENKFNALLNDRDMLCERFTRGCNKGRVAYKDSDSVGVTWRVLVERLKVTIVAVIIICGLLAICKFVDFGSEETTSLIESGVTLIIMLVVVALFGYLSNSALDSVTLIEDRLDDGQARYVPADGDHYKDAECYYGLAKICLEQRKNDCPFEVDILSDLYFMLGKLQVLCNLCRLSDAVYEFCSAGYTDVCVTGAVLQLHRVVDGVEYELRRTIPGELRETLKNALVETGELRLDLVDDYLVDIRKEYLAMRSRLLIDVVAYGYDKYDFYGVLSRGFREKESY